MAAIIAPDPFSGPKQNSGFIDVYSKPRNGATFTIYLPRHVGKIEPVQATGGILPLPCGHETILLVEDEPSLLQVTKMNLEELGYRVLSAATPEKAIDLTRRHAGSIHLLMTDVIMPEMNGRDLARSISALCPTLKRLFMSAYSADVIAHQGVLDDGVHFIQKPFTMKDLAMRIRQTLDEK